MFSTTIVGLPWDVPASGWSCRRRRTARGGRMATVESATSRLYILSSREPDEFTLPTPGPHRPTIGVNDASASFVKELTITADGRLAAPGATGEDHRIMTSRQVVAGLLAFSMLAGTPAPAWSALDAQAAPAEPAPPPGNAPTTEAVDVTPPRISYFNGQVSFWRPGADDWAPAKINTPLAPGDVLYAGPDGNVEVQVGPRAFVRAAEGTQIGLDNQEQDFLQLRLTGGLAALDFRELPAGQTVELDTPNAVFTIERMGFFRADVEADTTSFRAHRGGVATMTPAGGEATQIGGNQQVVVTGSDMPRVETGAAPALSAWDKWNYERTDYVIRSASARYVPRGTYGTEELDQHGTWRTVDNYGTVWAPSGVPAGWVPYSTGRWIWDPRFGWTWLDDAPWGWAPYHHGRWVFVGSYWAWAPGPIVVRPVYAPALVVFLGGPVRVGVRPVFWAPLAWGEPVVPWWGRPGFVGVATWRGWGGPHVVNNVVVNKTTTVNVTNINVYRNVTVNNAVVGVSSDRFGHHDERPRRIEQAEARKLAPVRGAPDVKPVAASVTVASGTAVKPPASMEKRAVVATRPPHDASTRLRDQGIAPTRTAEPNAPPRIVPAPKAVRGTEPMFTRPQPGPRTAPGQQGDTPEGRSERPDRGGRRERNQPQAMPAPSQTQPPRSPAPSQTPAQPNTPAQQQAPAAPQAPAESQRPAQSRTPSDRQAPAQSPAPSQAPGQQRQQAAPRPDPGAKGGEQPERGDPGRGQAQHRPGPPRPPSPAREQNAARAEQQMNRADRQERGQQRPPDSAPARQAPPEQRSERQDKGQRQERPEKQ